MTMTTGTAQPILRADEVVPLLLEPIARQSIAAQVATVLYTQSPTVRLPRMDELDVAEWLPEGEEIPLGDITFGEVIIKPSRLVGGSVVTQELLEDSSPEASRLIGDALAADLARKTDMAFFGSRGSNPEQPAGLGDLQGISQVTGNLWDGAFQAEAAAEAAGGRIDAWVTHPSTASEVGKLSKNMPGGVASDPTTTTRRALLGVPIVSTPLVPAGLMWGIDRAAVAFVMRTNAAAVEADSSVFFTSFKVALRARVRLGWGFPAPGRIVRFNVTDTA